MTYKIAQAILKTENEMKHDYSVAKYPYSRATYDHFVALNKNNKPQSNTKALSGMRDKNGIHRPADEVISLAKELRNLFDKQR